MEAGTPHWHSLFPCGIFSLTHSVTFDCVPYKRQVHSASAPSESPQLLPLSRPLPVLHLRSLLFGAHLEPVGSHGNVISLQLGGDGACSLPWLACHHWVTCSVLCLLCCRQVSLSIVPLKSGHLCVLDTAEGLTCKDGSTLSSCLRPCRARVLSLAGSRLPTAPGSSEEGPGTDWQMSGTPAAWLTCSDIKSF